MAEYVDKEIVKEAIGMIANACIANPRITCGEIQTFSEGIPTADVRPVVLCGGCCWFTDTGYPEPDPDMPELRMGHCLFLCRDVQACWFCGAGEQKEDANSLTEAIERNTTKIVEKSNGIRAEYIRHLQEKNKALDEELASLREAFLQATRGGQVDGNEKD